MSELPPLPNDAKQILPFILRSQEMSSRDASISYWCKMHAARLSLQYANDIPTLRPWLLQLMDHLEHEKTNTTNELITNPTLAFSHLENFALKIFAAADREDRAGNANLRTAKTFLAASNYLDVLSSVVHDDDTDLSDVKEKSKYAKWKATDIVKAIKSGAAPLPGPPLAPNSEHVPPPFPNSSSNAPTAAPAISPSTPSSSTPTGPSFPPTSTTPKAISLPAAFSGQSPLPLNNNLPDPRVIAQAQKLARFAISALEYDDVSTAVDNLRQALDVIAPLDPRSPSFHN